MAANREVISVMVFNVQALYVNKLWEPDTKDQAGKALDKPNYSLVTRVAKTKQHWWDEPEYASVLEACKRIFQTTMAPAGIPFERVEWPVRDGDQPNKKNVVKDYAKGHWLLSGNTNYPPRIEAVIEGKPVELASPVLGGRKIADNGDLVCVTFGIAKRTTDAFGIKAYLNAVVFTEKGTKIELGNNATGAEMLAAAQAQGIAIKGMGSPVGGFGQSGGSSFQPSNFQPGAPSFKNPFGG